MSTEPVAWSGALTTLVTAVMALAVGFDWVDWTTDQQALVLAVLVALIGCVTIWQRSQVSPKG